ncbi:DUF2993 domain-containing protein [Streptomyces sp. PTM05]|uniref:DUF2993 domain-containing protein n=1 Tax=Streptantibioticus parmotrematis TaxID=2873249 RepID=A0ABS7QPE4_9ACTN|nr:DUF2993 domain-containing protein [Streptantibioticus parmotrematis]MBY8885053.1 DUF2993 domain-containing protein [Streptantibioticus parmotrematis]
MRGRGIRILVVVVVVLGGLFVAADRIAVSYAQSKIADRIQSARGLSSKPDVSIKGFPFLTQVAGRDLNEVTATATDFQAAQGTSASGDGRLRIDKLTVDLHDVRIDSSFSSAVADTATGTALISYADLQQGAPDGVTVSYGGDGQVKVSGSITLLGQTIRRSVVSSVQVTGGNTVQLHAKTIPDAGTIPGLGQLVRDRIDFARTLSGLPAGITLSGVQATQDGVVVSLTGQHVSLTSS